MGMTTRELENEVVRLRQLRQIDKEISEVAEEKARELRSEEVSCATRLKLLHERIREAVKTNDISGLPHLLDECDTVTKLLLHLPVVR